MPRLDQELMHRGLIASRSLGAKLIKEGFVAVNGTVQKKASFPVGEEDEILLLENELSHYVSRGAFKLIAALDRWEINPKGLVCADIGASTGGFTQVLLERGAARIFAVDSGTNQLHPTLRAREEVQSLENVNARFLDEGLFGKVDLVVMDVSFISQSLLYPAVRKILLPGGILISLIKPQFEVGREHIGSGGIVKNEKVRLACPEKLKAAAEKQGLLMQDVIPSPILGGDGNREFLAIFIQKNENRVREDQNGQKEDETK